MMAGPPGSLPPASSDTSPNSRSLGAFAAFIDCAPTAMAVLRLECLDDPASLRILAGNPAAAELLGTTSEKVEGQLLVELQGQNPLFLKALAKVVTTQSAIEVPVMRAVRLDRIFYLRAMPLDDQCIGVSLDDVTKSVRDAESLRHQALHDHLTGLPNRARFSDRLERAFTKRRRVSTRSDRREKEPDDSLVRDIAVLIIDLDRFKEVNDSLGHDIGDHLLVEVAGRLSRNIRDCDTIARLGGDEFAILIDDSNAAAISEEVARRVEALCTRQFEVEGYRLNVGASIGVAVLDDSMQDPTELVRCADVAMYRAKESGCGIVQHSPDACDNSSRLVLSTELTEAVQQNQFVVHYQPRIALKSMAVVGVEALIRWRHPSRGLLTPGEFIDLAETSGAIQPLTRMVTERAAAELLHLHDRDDLNISVNMSDRNLFDPDFVDSVAAIVDRTGYPVRALCFETTEDQLASDPKKAMAVLKRLRGLGVRLSIDHFGSGYFSLAYLRELPIDEVKIDPEIVRELPAGDYTLVRTIIEIGHSLGLHVVAEGVESAEVANRLRQLGCDSAQGFHFAPPMALPALLSYLDCDEGNTDPASQQRISSMTR